MADTSVNTDQSVDLNNTPKAAKDKKCPYCGQAFTSSSLGRHLDLYIKEKNPKPPDGLHDVDAIRKMRGNITRRQPRGSLQRDSSTPARTPTAASRRSPISEDTESTRMRSPTATQSGDVLGRQYPFNTPWEATGVINDIAAKPASEAGDAAADVVRPLVPPQRAVSRQMMKAQIDMKQKIQDAADTAKAAELALREMMSAWRAAKHHIDMHSMPFDFDPLSLDFPALCLQCLETPPTLFSSTQYPSATSWSILPPGEKQFEALKRFFTEEFKKWRITCAAATTSFTEDLTYPPAIATHKDDLIKDAVRRAEQAAESLEEQLNEHLQAMFTVWQELQEQQRQEYWILELARGVGRKQKELDAVKETQHALKQENANLKTQIEHLNRLQQPREFRIMTPTTIRMPKSIIEFFQTEGVVHGKSGVGMKMNDRHSDLNTLVATAIDRWKKVVVSTRATGGMQGQRSLNTPTGDQMESSAANNNGQMNNVDTPQAQRQAAHGPRQESVPTLQTPQPKRPAANMGNGALYEASTATQNTPSTDHRPPSTAPTTGTTSGAASVSAGADEDMSDQDADGDAEMDDDAEYASIETPTAGSPPKTEPSQPTLTAVPNQRAGPLEVPRSRGAAEQQFTNTVARSATQGGPGVRRAANAVRSATMQGVGGGGDPMFVD